jgi:hypothetical protein
MMLFDKLRSAIAYRILGDTLCPCGHSTTSHKPNDTSTGECGWFDCRCGKTMTEALPIELANLAANKIGVDLKSTLQKINQIKDGWLK